jgi:hypothetical protein
LRLVTAGESRFVRFDPRIEPLRPRHDDEPDEEPEPREGRPQPEDGGRRAEERADGVETD